MNVQKITVIIIIISISANQSSCFVWKQPASNAKKSPPKSIQLIYYKIFSNIHTFSPKYDVILPHYFFKSHNVLQIFLTNIYAITHPTGLIKALSWAWRGLQLGSSLSSFQNIPPGAPRARPRSFQHCLYLCLTSHCGDSGLTAFVWKVAR